MDICEIDQLNRKEIDDFIICQWFSLQMVLHGESVDLGAADGWYAVQDDDIVGLITYRILDDRMEILSLDSLKEQHGIGTALLNMAVSYARNNGITKITLITTNDNLPALRFYQKRGFDLEKRKWIYNKYGFRTCIPCTNDGDESVVSFPRAMWNQ